MLFKSIIVLIVAAVALTATTLPLSGETPTPPPTPTVYPSGACFRPLKGDFTNDGVVDMADTLGFLKDLGGIYTVTGITCGMDINCDFDLDFSDLLAMLGYYAGADYFHPVRENCVAIGFHQGPV